MFDPGEERNHPGQHAGLTEERWASFPLDRQILMIANEMHRASKLMTDADTPSRRLAYERVLRLVDLTVAVNDRPALRRELLRWRDLIAALHAAAEPDPEAHRALLRSLLLTTPASAKQIPYVCQ
jgi:hypothetical protein